MVGSGYITWVPRIVVGGSRHPRFRIRLDEQGGWNLFETLDVGWCRVGIYKELSILRSVIERQMMMFSKDWGVLGKGLYIDGYGNP